MRIRSDRPVTLLLLGAVLLGAALFLRQTVPPAVAVDDQVTTQPYFDTALPPLQQGQLLSQEFTADRDSLSGITLLVVVYHTPPPAATRLTLRLFTPGDSRPLATQTVAAATLQHNAVYTFRFAPQRASAGRPYRLEISSDGDAPVSFWSAGDDLFPGWETHLDGSPSAGDVYLTTIYSVDPRQLLSELPSLLWPRLPQTLLLLFLLLLPGWLLTRYLQPDPPLDLVEQFAVALSLGLTLIALLFLWVGVPGGTLSRGVARLLTGLLIGGTALALWRRPSLRPPAPRRGEWAGLLLLGGILLLRLVQIRTLLLPPGIDAPHHVLIADIIAATGRAPTQFVPWLPIEEARYHFGFHAAAAWGAWLSGLSIPTVVLLLGQGISAGISGAVYFLTRRLTGRWDVALLALGISGFISPFPGHLLVWGRYTALAGLLLLPVACGLLLLELPPRRLLPATGFLWAGLFLTHYNMLAIGLCFLPAALLLPATNGTPWRPRAALILRTGLVALLLAAPWLIHLLSTLDGGRLGLLAGLPVNEGRPVIDLLGEPPFPWLMLLAGLAGGWALVRRKQWMQAMWLWLLLATLLANTPLLGMLRVFLLNNATLMLWLFLPVVIAAAGGITAALRRLPWRTGLRAGLAGAALLLSLAGSWRQVPLVERDFGDVTPSDLAAMTWIQDHVPPDARFLVNSWFLPGQPLVGPDAGVWLPLLTGRSATLPPITYGQGPLAYQAQVEALARGVQADPTLRDSELLALLQEEGVTHVYLGARPGLMTPLLLADHPHLQPLYAEQGVWIYALR